MTTQPTYIYSDAECVLGIKDKDGKFIQFTDQAAARYALFISNGILISEIKPNTIYTVEGYGVEYRICKNEAICGSCIEIKCSKLEVHLKRIEQESAIDDKEKWNIIWRRWANVAEVNNKEKTDSALFNWLFGRYTSPDEKTATLKRIEPVVEKENDGWIMVDDNSLPEDDTHLLFMVGKTIGKNDMRLGWFHKCDQFGRANMFCDGSFHHYTTVTHYKKVYPPKQ